jgi:hypothetical protein
MQVINYGLAIFYVLMMPILFWNWYGLYQQEPDLSRTERRISRVVLMISTLLWPIVLPLSYLELLGRVKRYERLANRSQFAANRSFTAMPEMN